MNLFSRKPEAVRVKVKIDVPIYNLELWVIIDNEAGVRREEMSQKFGAPTLQDWAALCSYGSEGVGLFFYPDRLNRGLVAHEVFHATAMILRLAGVKFDGDNHEAHAYLCGWVTDEVYAVIDKAGEGCLQTSAGQRELEDRS